MPREPIEIRPELAVLLRRLSLTYCWDMTPEDVLLQPLHVLRRAMDFAVWDDILAMEATRRKAAAHEGPQDLFNGRDAPEIMDVLACVPRSARPRW
jgi:hypothetical protein